MSANEDVGPLLRPLRYTAEGHVLKDLVGTLSNPVSSLSYTRLLERCQEMCRFVGLDKAMGLHSFPHLSVVLQQQLTHEFPP
jgi:hypothetical protein